MNRRILFLANHDMVIYNFRRELVERLLKEENEVYISSPYGDRIDLLTAIGCKFIKTEFNRHGKNPVKDIDLFKRYCRIIKEIKPNVVLTYTIKPNIYGGIACQFCGVPYISNVTGLGTSIENGGILSFISCHLYKTGIKKASTVFFQNKYNQELFETEIFKPDNTLLLPGSGVNLMENCLEQYPDEGPLRFLFIGRIMKDKGIEEYLACAKYVKSKHPSFCFSIVGPYDDDSYADEITKLSEEGIITYYGFQKDIHSIIKKHHAIIHPSYHEGLSNVLLEAAATGRPILASLVPGCMETFDNGISGIGFEVKNAQSLIAAVDKFIALPYEEKKEMGLRGRKKVEREFDRKIVVSAYIEEIDKAVKSTV